MNKTEIKLILTCIDARKCQCQYVYGYKKGDNSEANTKQTKRHTSNRISFAPYIRHLDHTYILNVLLVLDKLLKAVSLVGHAKLDIVVTVHYVHHAGCNVFLLRYCLVEHQTRVAEAQCHNSQCNEYAFKHDEWCLIME